MGVLGYNRKCLGNCRDVVALTAFRGNWYSDDASALTSFPARSLSKNLPLDGVGVEAFLCLDGGEFRG